MVLERLDQLAVDEVEHAGRFSTSVTCMPSAAAIDAYSRPITPPPITVSVRGSSTRCRIPSESSTVRSSNSTPGGRAGTVPTAITIFSPAISKLPRAVDAQRVRVGERRGAVEHAHAVAAQLVCDHVLLVLDHLCVRHSRSSIAISCLSGTRCRRPTRPGRSAREAARSVFDGTVPVLVETPPTRRARRARRACRASRLDGGALTGRPGADRDQVELVASSRTAS